MKANVRRSPFYTALKRNRNENTTIDTVDVAEHAQKRKILNLCFNERSLSAACKFIADHVDRWNELMLDEINTNDWSSPIDLGKRIEELVFDVIGEISFGRSFNIKEPEENPLKQVPHCIENYMLFYYPFCRSPFLGALNWLKPRGLDKFFDLVSPRAVKQYNEFLQDSVMRRISLQQEQASKPDEEKRHDLFHFLYEARDPDTKQRIYNETDLRAESNMLGMYFNLLLWL
ncbi:hypothetical protein ONZ43_g1908 [Nemania bipapillata]|uniref:Uncharacterized protein n=1 Tax=Nemania bipapillata TaxID=110536 RepID=A0ACC2J2P5_9PEZI|nr:hypothetical protein ONZ43_g1908 [Nemania bipapillata]